MERPQPQTARIGRPRASAQAPVDDPREDLLAAAAELFTTVGYARATTRAIARAAGLRQPSMFHYFPRKEDLLSELLTRTIEPALSYVEQLETESLEPEVKLYALIRKDVTSICSGRWNLAALYLIPEARGARFAPFWERRDRLLQRYRDFIEAGLTAGRLQTAHPDLLPGFVWGTVESVATWFERDAGTAPEAVGELVAESLMRGLLHDAAELERVRADAARAGL